MIVIKQPVTDNASFYMGGWPPTSYFDSEFDVVIATAKVKSTNYEIILMMPQEKNDVEQLSTFPNARLPRRKKIISATSLAWLEALKQIIKGAAPKAYVYENVTIKVGGPRGLGEDRVPEKIAENDDLKILCEMTRKSKDKIIFEELYYSQNQLTLSCASKIVPFSPRKKIIIETCKAAFRLAGFLSAKAAEI